MVALGNPIIGILRPNDWVRPAGNTDMRVTQTAAQHIARGGPPALDIGDAAADLDPILAPHDGVVAQAFTVGSANLSIDFNSGGQKWRIVLAHNTLPHPVSLGQAVKEGQQVGRMGNTSSPTMPVSIHLHIQLGHLVGSSWVWVDPWVYLRQNGALEDDQMVPIPPGKFVELANKKTSTISNANFRAERLLTAAILKLYPLGTAFVPLMQADDGSPAGGATPTRWFGGFGLDDRGFAIYGWFHSSVLGPLVDTTPGHTDAELIEAAKRASYNAANDVSAMAVATAAKYPKP
jgi:hypothetical protein